MYSDPLSGVEIVSSDVSTLYRSIIRDAVTAPYVKQFNVMLRTFLVGVGKD